MSKLKITLCSLAFSVIFSASNLFCQTNQPSAAIPQQQAERPLETIKPTLIAVTNAIVIKLEQEALKALQEMTEDKWFKRDMILGGLIAALAGILAGVVIHCQEVRQRKKEESEFEDNVLKAILYELDALGKIYDSGMGEHQKQLEKSDILPVRLSLTQNWFTIFDTNTVHLGKIDAAISKQIIFTYAEIKRLIEDLRINNDYLAQKNQIESQLRLAPHDVYLIEQRKTNHQWMTAQFTRIKEEHSQCKNSVNAVKVLLANRGIS